MNKITKAVIPVAGYGTRFLPTTKAQPKEMLNIVDKPVIQYIVEDAVASGITDIVLVTGQGKRAIEDHFDHNAELYNWLIKQGKTALKIKIKEIAELANFIYIRQKGPYGNGTPVLCAREIIGDEAFAVLFGDDIFYGKKPRLKQLIDVYEKYGDPVLTACRVSKKDTSRYGIIDAVQVEKRVYQVKKLVEKPGPKKTPSTLASIGGFVLTPDIFDALEKTKLGKGGELWLSDAIAKIGKKRPIYACEVDSTYYDVGSKLGWLEANVDFALKRPELKNEFKKYLKKLT
ncbi:UTP--glucose-1-phosphate uridylyltransferase GalU [Patescibacteria group bacterium]|nr:UTP--glucose-1-phosphate uridylyltransferase GalU [Patescibacteria group bacterium]